MSDIEVTIEQSLDHIINGEIVRTSGTDDYNELTNKPSINGVELIGNKTTSDLGIKVDTSNLATKDEIPTKTSELENDSGFITDVSEALKSGEYIEVYKPAGETLYEYSSYFNETNMGVVTANNVTCLTKDFGGNSLDVMTGAIQLENAVSEMYGFKLPDSEVQYILPLIKADNTPYRMLDVLSDSFYQMSGATDLSDESKASIIQMYCGGNVDPYTSVYVLKMTYNGESILTLIYRDNFGNYVLGLLASWNITPVSETTSGEAKDYYVVDLNKSTAEQLNKNTSDIQALNTKVDNLPTGGAEYTAGDGITISDNVISANTNIQVKGIFNYSTTYKAGEIVKYHIDDTDGYQYFISIQNNNKGRYPSDYNNDYWAVLNNTSQLTYIENHTDIPVCMISSGGTFGNTPNAWRIIVPSNLTNLAKMPTINSTTGVMKVPSGIEGYYTKEKVDSLVGDLGTILDEINGEII